MPTPQIPESLIFNPHWRGDPPIWWFTHQLDKSAQQKLAQAQLEHQQKVLAAQQELVTQALAIIRGGK